MGSIGDLRLFVHAAELGSLSAAGRALNLSAAAASAALKRLEAELGTRLIVRSTRSLRLSRDGERYLRHCRTALQALDDGRHALGERSSQLRGSLQLSASSDLGRHLLLDWLDAFQTRHPRLRVRLRLSDQLTNIYQEPVDAVIRYGAPADSKLIAIPLLEGRRHLCAAPVYLDRHGAPDTPEDLARHNCLRFQLRGEVHGRWRFGRDGEWSTVRVDGDRASDDGDVVRRWALAGHGIAYKSWPDIAADVRAGRLHLLCPDWQGEHAPLHLVYPDRRPPQALRLLRDHLIECCAGIAPPQG